MTIATAPYCAISPYCKRKCNPPQCNEAIKYICIDSPYYDMCSLCGRFKHFLSLTCPTGAFKSKHHIERSSDLIFNFRHKRLKQCVTEKDLWHHRYVTYANTHPDTREVYHPLTRWPHQVLVNTVIAAGMLTFCKTYPGLALWQWANQSYQAYIAWNHRNVPSCVSDRQVINSYIIGTAGSIGTAVGLRYVTTKYFKCVPFFVPKLIPLAALLVGNMLAVPALRAQDLKYGVPVYDHLHKRLGASPLAAQNDVHERVIVKNATYFLPLLVTPFVMHPFRRDTYYWICKYPFLRKLLLLSTLGGLFAFSTPFALALFKCPGEMSYCDLERCIRNRVETRLKYQVSPIVYYKSEC